MTHAPSQVKQYPTPCTVQKAVEKEIHEMPQLEIIEKSVLLVDGRAPTKTTRESQWGLQWAHFGLPHAFHLRLLSNLITMEASSDMKLASLHPILYAQWHTCSAHGRKLLILVYTNYALTKAFQVEQDDSYCMCEDSGWRFLIWANRENIFFTCWYRCETFLICFIVPDNLLYPRSLHWGSAVIIPVVFIQKHTPTSFYCDSIVAALSAKSRFVSWTKTKLCFLFFD